jgi:ParB-like nuclease domain
MTDTDRRPQISGPSVVPIEGPPPTAASVPATGDPAPPLPSRDTPPERRIESWPIAGLREHEQQAALFHDLDGADFENLIENIKQEGLRDPIWVMPDGRIVDGHQRARAARRLGWTKISAWVEWHSDFA